MLYELMKIVVILILCFTSGCLGQEIKTQSVESSVQEKTQFEQFYKISSTPTQKERDEVLAKIREFIWNNWQTKQKSSLKLEQYTKEGEKVLTTYEIINEEEVGWILKVNIERENVARGEKARSSENTFHTSQNFIVKDMDRIEIPNDGLEKRKVIPQSEIRSSEEYFLRLKNENEDIFQEI